MKKIIFTCIVFVAMLSGCKKEKVVADPNATYKGAAQVIGNGKVYSWFKFKDNIPASIGITFSKGALQNITHDSITVLVIALPAEAIGKTGFDHVYFDFSWTGHEPMGVYDVPHFDVHFMMQSNAERSVIPAYSAATATKFDNIPPYGIMPDIYSRLPQGVALMGTHWVDKTTPEFNNGKFTETLIMGSYDGKMTFLEPMVTLELLLTKPNITQNVPLPKKFAHAVYFPTKYGVNQVGDDAVISLDEMVLMQ